jgi:hypothetical protein
MKTLAALFCLLAFPAWAQTLPCGTCCNTNGFSYTGVFAGNIYVSPGQLCGFTNGRITGDVIVNGGVIGIYGTTIGGSVVIENTTQPGDIYIDGICGSTVKGFTRITKNYSEIVMGPAYKFACPGNTFIGPVVIKDNYSSWGIFFYDNTFGSNVWVVENRAEIVIVMNKIAGDLICRGLNGLIARDNTAHRIIGQCGERPGK